MLTLVAGSGCSKAICAGEASHARGNYAGRWPARTGEVGALIATERASATRFEESGVKLERVVGMS